MGKTLSNEECQVIVHAVKGLAKTVRHISEHIRHNMEEDTFQHVAEPFETSADFMKSTVYQLEKIQKRLQGE